MKALQLFLSTVVTDKLRFHESGAAKDHRRRGNISDADISEVVCRLRGETSGRTDQLRRGGSGARAGVRPHGVELRQSGLSIEIKARAPATKNQQGGFAIAATSFSYTEKRNSVPAIPIRPYRTTVSRLVCSLVGSKIWIEFCKRKGI